jgi:flagellar assembly protein FliH
MKKRTLMSSSSTASKSGASGEAEPFVFAPPNGAAAASHSAAQSQAAGPQADPQAEQLGYAKGLAEGEERSRAAFEKKLSDLRVGLAETIRQFGEQRENYFRSVESEVVQLALSIARKILHREAQLDPLLLTGIVRVALDSLNEGTQVRLLANPPEVSFWRAYFEEATQIGRKPEIIGDASLGPGCCALDTELGSTRISLETQIKEIEQGFLDLLEHRPKGRE